MSTDFRLSAQKRDKTGSRETLRLRRAGRVPANLYGLGKDTVSLSVCSDDVTRLIDGGSKIVDVEVDGTVDKAVVVELQWDTFSTKVQHVDMKRVDPAGSVTVDVKVEVTGEPVGLKSGGQFRQLLKQLSMSGNEFRIPKQVTVRVGALDVGDAVRVSDVKVPAGVTIQNSPEEVVAEVYDPRKSA